MINPYLAIGAAALSAGANIAANASNPLGPRIRQLKQAQATGGLAADDQRVVDAQFGAAQRNIAATKEDQQRALAMMGDTSGAAIKATGAAADEAVANAAERAADTFRQARAAEKDELAGLQEVRRQRIMDTIGSAVQGGMSGATAAARLDAYTNDKSIPAETPDFSTIPDEMRGEAQAAWQAQAKLYSEGKMTRKQWNQYQQDFHDTYGDVADLGQ